jgi:hypothetical protein
MDRMQKRGIVLEMIIAVGVAAGVMAIGLAVLIAAGPEMRRPKNMPTICTLDRISVLGQSAVGRSVNLQLFELINGAQDSINAEKLRVDKIPKPVASEQGTSLLQQRVQRENARLEGIRAEAKRLVVEAIAPTLRQESAHARCMTVFDRSAVIENGQARDLTSAVLKALDRRVLAWPPGTLARLTARMDKR